MSRMMVEPRDDGWVVLVEGDLTIERSGEFKAILVEALSHSGKIWIDTRNTTRFCLAGLQLLCAAHKSACGRNQDLILIGTENRVLAQAMEEAGFGRRRGCRYDRDHTCFWVIGDQG